jgi:uncharacterized protein (DUF1015 family)
LEMEVKPFRALRYDSGVVGDVGSCISPPYDVINAEQQQSLYERNEYNIVRIIKGKTEPSDDGTNNQYTRAAQYLNSWIAKGALKKDEAETIYGYVQDFQIAGEDYHRLSFIALAKLEEFGKIVRPHEQTLSGPKVDRLNLQRATAAAFGLVYMLYDDPQMVADKVVERAAQREPLLDFVDDAGVRHRLYAVRAPKDIEAVEKMMADKSFIIADGHHRYETGLAYSRENPSPAARYQMIAFSNTRHEGLVVLATHRLVSSVEEFDFARLLERMKENFDISEYEFDSTKAKEKARRKMLADMRAQLKKNKNAFGIYAATGAFYMAVLRDGKAMGPVAPDKSRAWRALDVAVLHKLILEKYLGIDEDRLTKESNVEYVKDTESAIDDSIARVDSGEKQAAFLMNPPKLEQIQAVADQGEKMPQKSTYFYPKVFTGLTINKF